MEISSLKQADVQLSDLQRISSEGKLHIILDACDSKLTLSKVQELGEENAPCLYTGDLEPSLLADAPYLTKATPDLCAWIRAELWAEPWGIFILAELATRDIRKHLRKLLTAQGPGGQTLLFRYYDPRVIGPFLQSCSREELQNFFGGILAFGTSDGDHITFYYQNR